MNSRFTYLLTFYLLVVLLDLRVFKPPNVFYLMNFNAFYCDLNIVYELFTARQRTKIVTTKIDLFQTFFSLAHLQKMLKTMLLKISTHLKCVVTLSCAVGSCADKRCDDATIVIVMSTTTSWMV